MSAAARVLVIKLGALGDFVQAFGPFAAIRRHHAAAGITLLTTAPFAALAEASGWFDAVVLDTRPAWWRIGAVLELRRRLRAARPDRVYDLQTSGRSSAYFRLFGLSRPDWSGIAAGSSHPHANPQRDLMHTIERQAEQLRMAGIDAPDAAPDLAWLDTDVARFDLPPGFVLLAPGGAAHRSGKRWPHFADLARRLAASGRTPVLLGTAADADAVAAIRTACPAARDLSGRTALLEIAGLARRAAGAVGNDTGPMHLIAATGCPSLVLFSHDSDPALCAQRGPAVAILRRPDLAALEPEEVEARMALR